MKRKLLIIGILCTGILFISAEESSDMTSFYDANMITTGYNIFGGITLNYQGQSTSIARGLPRSFQQPLLSCPESSEYYNEYKKKNTLGNGFEYGGLGLILLTSFSPLFFLPSINADDNPSFDKIYYPVYFSALLTGLVSTIIGETLVTTSYSRLLQGVNIYNRKKTEEF